MKVCLTRWHDTRSPTLARTVLPECKTCWRSLLQVGCICLRGHMMHLCLDSSAGALSCQALLTKFVEACPCSICPYLPAQLGQSQEVAQSLLLFRLIPA